MSTTVGELKKALEHYPDDTEVIFGCHELKYSRLKPRGEKLVQVEFSQNIYRTEEGEWVVVD